MPTDQVKRRALIDRCNAFARSHGLELPAVTIEEFFDGNGDEGSIMPNLETSSLDRVRAQLEEIRARPDVHSLLVRIHETMEDDEECWPYAEEVIITTTADAGAVRAWFRRSMAPDEVSELERPPPGVPVAPPGARVLAAWWD